MCKDVYYSIVYNGRILKAIYLSLMNWLKNYGIFTLWCTVQFFKIMNLSHMCCPERMFVILSGGKNNQVEE